MPDHYTHQLSDYLDNELDSAQVMALESHLATCAECAAVLEDLRRVVARAQALEERESPRDLWPGVAALIGSELHVPRSRWNRRWTVSLPQLLAAAAALVLVTGVAVFWLGQIRRAHGGAIAIQSADTTRPAMLEPVSTVPGAHPRGYDQAVADLQAVLDQGRGKLDTATVRVLDQSLQKIDRAIAEAERALQSDPHSVYLNGYLAQTRMRKLDLLRRAAALANAAS